MQKKLTLDGAWVKCLRMWRWIVKKWKKDPAILVSELKEKWLTANDPKAELLNDCYFCEYARRQNPRMIISFLGCRACPARKVEASFHCEKDTHHWFCYPDKFLAKLEQLNKKRRGK